MTILGMKRRAAWFLVNRIFAGTGWFETKRHLLNFAGYAIGTGTKIVGPVVCTGMLNVGENCWIGRDLRIHGNGTVEIGDRCDLGPEVVFLTGGHQIGSARHRAGQGESYHIMVEPGCWICGRVTVTGSVTLGRGSVIAACGCVVTDVPENTLAGGVPAKVRKVLDE